MVSELVSGSGGPGSNHVLLPLSMRLSSNRSYVRTNQTARII